MSWEEDFDTALASHPWRPLTASGHITSHSTTTSSFILKHAPHPSRPGYIVLLTDLSSVYLEELTAPGVPSRLREVARLPPLAKAANGKGKKQEVEDEEDMDDIVKQSEAALKRVQGLCAALTGREGEGEEGEVQASVEAGDYHDAVLTIRSNTFSWIFNLTEIKGRQPLEILATQLIGPLASQALLSDAANGQTKKSKRDAIAIDFLHTLFSASAYKGDNTSRAKPVLTPEPRSSKGKASRETPSPSAQGSPSPARRRAPSGRPTPVVHASRPRPRSKAGKVADPADASDEEANRQDEDLQESPEYASPSPTPVKPKTKRSTPGRKTHASSSPEAQASVKPGATSTSTIKSDRDHVTRKAAESPSRESPASAAASAPASPSPTPAPDASNGAEAEPEIDASQAASQAKSQTKRQREEAEEAELEKRAEEMKRKMAGGGGGGGVLGRRRLRR